LLLGNRDHPYSLTVREITTERGISAPAADISIILLRQKRNIAQETCNLTKLKALEKALRNLAKQPRLLLALSNLLLYPFLAFTETSLLDINPV